MERVNKTIYTSIIASETMHIFCCVLPTLFSVVSLMAGMGMIATMPSFIEQAHHAIHAYEIPMIIISGLVLTLGWGLYGYSLKLNCTVDGACDHEPCAPQKDKTRLFMIVATVLFVVNVSVYFLFHKPMDRHFHDHGTHATLSSYEHGHDHHHHH